MRQLYLARPHGVRCGRAPIGGVGPLCRTLNTPPAVSSLYPMDRRATKALQIVRLGMLRHPHALSTRLALRAELRRTIGPQRSTFVNRRRNQLPAKIFLRCPSPGTIKGDLEDIDHVSRRL
jgi:hypothetical protein